jgi:hypothetical protein
MQKSDVRISRLEPCDRGFFFVFTSAICPCVYFPMSLSFIFCSYHDTALFLFVHSSLSYVLFTSHRLCFLRNYSCGLVLVFHLICHLLFTSTVAVLKYIYRHRVTVANHGHGPRRGACTDLLHSSKLSKVSCTEPVKEGQHGATVNVTVTSCLLRDRAAHMTQ